MLGGLLQRPDTKKSSDDYPKWKVLLHNDDNVAMETVLYGLMVVVGLPKEEATRIMLEAHENDIALVKVCTEEHAEHYVQGLTDKGVPSSMEQA